MNDGQFVGDKAKKKPTGGENIDELSAGRAAKKKSSFDKDLDFFWSLVAVLGIGTMFYGFSDQIVFTVAYMAIEWVSTSAVATMLIGAMVLFVSVIGNRITQRALRRNG
jgi:divalent metal cation (Fe/Co/Zn/Cd) transporter